MKNWSFQKKVKSAFGAALLILLLIGWLAYASTTRFIENADWVTHTHQVLETLNATSSSITRAESVQRGYLLTGDTSFLDNYSASMQATLSGVKNLRQLTADNTNQQKRLDRLEPLI